MEVNLRSILPALALSVIVTGGAAAATPHIDESELLALGFKVLVATTTAQQEWVQRLAPGQIRAMQRTGKKYFIYPDAPKSQIYVGGPTVESVVGEKIAPRLMDRYLAHAAWEGAFRDEPDDPNRRDDFWQPVPGDHGSHGPFDRIAKRRSIQLWITMHRRPLLAALGAIAFAGCSLAMSRRRQT